MNAELLDFDRCIWDVDYRQIVKGILNDNQPDRPVPSMNGPRPVPLLRIADGA